MNHLTNKALLITWITLAYSTNVSAHSDGGILSVKASATHYYQVICGTSSAYLYLEVKGNGTSTTPIISAQISKNAAAKSTTDSNNTDKVASKGIEISEGDGGYHVTIAKSKAGTAKYSFQYHCKASNNDHTDTSFRIIERKN